MAEFIAEVKRVKWSVWMSKAKRRIRRVEKRAEKKRRNDLMPNSPERLVLFCNCCASDIISLTVKRQIKAALQNSGIAFKEVSELCGLAAKRGPFLKEIVKTPDLTIIACYPRTVKWLFHSAGAPLTDGKTKFFNMREQTAEEIITDLGLTATNTSGDSECKKEKPEWVPWFPVIDYSRCINCGKCLDFCLFGVYERMPDKTVKVVKPENCKNNCPACSRICPEVAIIFPKLTESPINGAEISEMDENRSDLKLDMDKLTGDDVYATLTARNKRAKSKLLRKRDTEQALKERDECKKKDGEKPCSCNNY